MPTLHALVDYYNVAEIPFAEAATYKDHRDAVDSLVSLLIEASRQFSPVPTELRLRLYGGWHNEADDSSTGARDILGDISARHFPYRSAQRVHLHLADSLVAFPTENLDHTLRRTVGFAPFSIGRREDFCSAPEELCCLEVLKSWRKGRCKNCDSCNVRTKEVVTSVRQKMVDTAIVTDLFTLAHSSTDAIAAVSNDDDIVPGVLGASQLTKKIALIHIGKLKTTAGDLLCSRLGVRVVSIRR